MDKWRSMGSDPRQPDTRCKTCKGAGRIPSFDLKGFRGYAACGHCQGTGKEPQPAAGCLNGVIICVLAIAALVAFLTGNLGLGFVLLACGALWYYTT